MSVVDPNAEVEISTPDRGRIDATSPFPDRGRKARTRSRISNGSAMLPNVDGRGPIYRRYKDIANAILSDQGGADQCSETRLQLVRRFAAISVLAEQAEAKLARGETIDISEHALLCRRTHGLWLRSCRRWTALG
jgi:hypothetical protein